MTSEVAELKRKLQASTGIEVSKQDLIFAGMTLNDMKKLSDYGATSGSVFELQVRSNDEIPIRLIGGRTFTIVGRRGMTIKEVKVRLGGELHVPESSIRLLSGGLELDDSKDPFDFVKEHGCLFLAEYGRYSNSIPSGGTLVLPAGTPTRLEAVAERVRRSAVPQPSEISPQKMSPGLVASKPSCHSSFVRPSRANHAVLANDVSPQEADVLRQLFEVSDAMAPTSVLNTRTASAMEPVPALDSSNTVFRIEKEAAATSQAPPTSSSQPSSDWRKQAQPGMEHWTSNTARIPLVDIRDLPSRSFGDVAADGATRSLLGTLPTRTSTRELFQNKNFLAHLMAGVARQEGVAVSLYDSGATPAEAGGGGGRVEDRTARHDDLQYMSCCAPSCGGLDAKDIQILSLHEPDKEWQGCSLQQILEDPEAFQLFTEQTRERIAKASGLESGNDIRLLMVREGSVQFVYTHHRYPVERVQAPFNCDVTERNFREEFTTYQSSKVHPLRHVMNIDLGSIDFTSPGAFKDFSNEGQTFQVGPANFTRPYHQPRGWLRMGLRVKGKYEDDQWLEPFQNPNCWYRAYHGTGGRQVFRSIVEQGLRPSVGGKLGVGVYVSPHVNYASGYAGTTTVGFSDNSQLTFRVVFMCAVRPGAIAREGYPGSPDHPGENSEWTILSGADVRPYGILIKQV